ncbi:cytochrome P450 82C4-like protein [Cinnamomum micranthum f. kanehirae]|uniref:Cytochrome P450 82C4-like protein n=2 Tax=Cinnamomum micranthum f. kanehirae TaxID=337451 RepID=A0A3S3MPA8_9MAGN|nr:cytochrome P450 82C4-like protein [Cinnamomum micranthum f. kanehirae]
MVELASPLQIIAGFVALVLFYTQWKRKKNESTNGKQPPQPAGALPVIGHLHQLGGGKLIFRVLGAMADKLGPVFMLRLGVNRVVVVSTWEAAKECFTTNDQALAGRPTNATGKYLGYDYAFLGFSSYGPYWRELRKIATIELLSNRQLELLKHVRASEVNTSMKELHNAWARNGNRPVKVEMKQQLKDVIFNIVVMMIAGKRYFGSNIRGDEGEARRFQKAIGELFYLGGIFLLSDSLPFLKWFDLGGYESAMKKAAKEMDSIMASWLEEHRRMRLSGVVEGREDFMHVMLSTLEGAKLSADYDQDTILKVLPLNLITAGTDTTSVTMTWALSLLLNNPNVLKKAQEELDTQVGKERNVDESDLKKLVYLQAIIKETLRLYPPGPLSVPHRAIESCYINGYYVPAGTWLISNLWKIQRDPRKWSDPEEYRPERFLTTQADLDFRGQHFEFIPFGSGRRSCPGISMAAQVMHLTLARLLHGFDLVTPFGEPVDMSDQGLGLTMPKEGPLEVLLTPRLPSELYQ